MNRHGPGGTMRWLKPREKPLFSKCPAGGQERRNFPSIRTKKPGVGVRAYSLRGALEKRYTRREREPGDQGWGEEATTGAAPPVRELGWTWLRERPSSKEGRRGKGKAAAHTHKHLRSGAGCRGKLLAILWGSDPMSSRNGTSEAGNCVGLYLLLHIGLVRLTWRGNRL